MATSTILQNLTSQLRCRVWILLLPHWSGSLPGLLMVGNTTSSPLYVMTISFMNIPYCTRELQFYRSTCSSSCGDVSSVSRRSPRMLGVCVYYSTPRTVVRQYRVIRATDFIWRIDWNAIILGHGWCHSVTDHTHWNLDFCFPWEPSSKNLLFNYTLYD